MQKITIFSDGASRGNPGKGGWGSVVVLGEHVRELGGREDMTTNNRMEILASHGGLKYVSDFLNQKTTHDMHGKSITIYTDSSYLINGATKWIHGWKKNGWMTSQKEEVLNKDLWLGIDNVIGVLASHDITIDWQYVGGHVGIKGNERCDEIATGFADGDMSTQDLYDGPISRYEIKDILDIKIDHEAKAKKTASNERSKAKAFSYVSMVGGEIKVHSTWSDCESRVKGQSGAKFKKSLSKEDEIAIIADFKSL